MFTVRVNENINVWDSPVVTRLYKGEQTTLLPRATDYGIGGLPVLAAAMRMRRLIACAEADNDAIALNLLSPAALSGVLYVHSVDVFVRATAGIPRRQLFALFHALAGFDASEFYTHKDTIPPAPTEQVLLPSSDSGWFHDWQLFPQQVETLQWMQHVERNGLCIHLPEPIRFDNNAYLTFDGESGMRLVDHYVTPTTTHPRGCVLHNAVGTGKTAVIIALALTSRPTRDRRSLRWVNSGIRGYEPRRVTTATLVCVPSNLVGQWKAEIAKFHPSATVVTLVDIRHHRRLRSDVVRDADYVITTYAFLRGKSYDAAILKAIQDMGYGRPPSSSRLINPDMLSMFFAENANALDERGMTFLETWDFDRIVLDELHEVRTMTQPQRGLLAYRLLTLSSGALWGVTASKPQTGWDCNQVLSLLAPGWERVAGAIHNQFLVEALYHRFGGENGVTYAARACLVRPTVTERAVIESMGSEERCVMACTSLRGCMSPSEENVIVGSQAEILDQVLQDNVDELRRREASLATQRRVREVLDQQRELGDESIEQALERVDRRLDVLQQQVRTLEIREGFLQTVANADEAQECPVCLEATADSMMGCGHLFCYKCALRLAQQCAVCRQRSTALYRIGDSRSAPEGCKLQCMLTILTELQQRAESCVVFIQWAPVLTAAYNFLQSQTGIPLFKLTGNVHVRQATLRRFDSCDSGVLLLSLDSSSSGLNLVKANHVIFMHALTQVDALQVERQAIARVARMGQTREVQVHHIIAEDTTEERVFMQIDRSLRFDRFVDGRFVDGPAS